MTEFQNRKSEAEERQPEIHERSTAGTLFLERRSYRRRRLSDASRLLPIVGAVLFLIPLFWQTDQGSVLLSFVFGYIFAIWAGLILLNVLFWFGVARWADGWGAGETGTPDPIERE